MGLDNPRRCDAWGCCVGRAEAGCGLLGAIITPEPALAADGCEEPQLAGTSDRSGAICDTELGVDAADVRADRVRRYGHLAGDFRPRQVRRKIPLARTPPSRTSRETRPGQRRPPG